MPKPADIPFSKMQKISRSGVFVKRLGHYGESMMRPDAHRDDYYIVVLLTAGSASVEIDFEKKELNAGELLMVSPWQVHKPSGGVPNAAGWLLAFSPEILSEPESRIVEEYSISPLPFRPDENIAADINTLCAMLERNRDNDAIASALASAIKSIVLSTLTTSETGISGRHRTISLKLRKLLDIHIALEKSPSAYASMLNISEVYLNEAVKKTTGLSVGAYIRNRIMIQAKRQLCHTSLSAKEIGYALGYEDYTYFSKLFKKETGMSPAEYRKNLK